MMDLGCTQLALGDTIGVGTPGQVKALIEAVVSAGIDVGSIAVHFHDTYGQALANVLVALQSGISTIDSSAGGLGGARSRRVRPETWPPKTWCGCWKVWA